MPNYIKVDQHFLSNMANSLKNAIDTQDTKAIVVCAVAVAASLIALVSTEPCATDKP